MSEPQQEEKVPMTEQEQKLFEKYGRLPKPSHLLNKKDKKYFDSADWALKGTQNPESQEVKQPTDKPIKE